MTQASSPESRMWASIAHISALAGLIIPFGNILGPLIVWLIKRNELPFVDQQGREALNFQISLTVYLIIAGILMSVLIGFVLLPIVAIAGLVFIILATIKANEGVAYKYPLTFRLIK
ncbi:DUF4870 domain-containing protein [filamentous cyanobacterium CCP5]|nr:DUF4870 domain-containing protein [filamentous cyanobacterium CCP5]